MEYFPFLILRFIIRENQNRLHS